MRRVSFFHFDVGSAIEYAGDIFLSWMEELQLEGWEIQVIKNQDQAYTLIDSLIEFGPDIIVLNEYYSKTVEAATYYKKFNPDVKIFFLSHTWFDTCNIIEHDVTEIRDGRTEEGIFDKIRFKHFLQEVVNEIMFLNYRPDGMLPMSNMHNFYYPTDDQVFTITTPWKDRPNLFCNLGNLLPHKLSKEFLVKVRSTDLVVDCYGKDDWDSKIVTPELRDYYRLAKASKNLKLLGIKPQSEVAAVLNQYKYFVMPHNGYEPFNWTLLQAIFCGTIPLVSNDRKSTRFDPSWIDWAEGLYLGTDTVDELVKNMVSIKKENPDLSELSSTISEQAQAKFNYSVMKDAFLDILRSL